MANITKTISIVVSLPDDSLYCKPCPAVGIISGYCLHLNVELEQSEQKGRDERIFLRNPSCPFNAPKCAICKNRLEPIEVHPNQWEMTHPCGDSNKSPLPEITIVGKTFNDVISRYTDYIITIKKRFTQR